MMLSIRWCLLMIFCWPGWLAAVEVVDGPRVEVAGASATVRWKLDVPAGGTVRFGLSEGALNRSEKSEGVARDHVVQLDGLKPGARYYYSVGTARRPLREGSFVAARGPGPKAPASPKAADTAKPGSADDPSTTRPSSPRPGSRAEAPPTSRTWANLVTLRDHYERHGRDFGAVSPEDYAARAWQFLQRAKSEGLPAKIDPEGTLRVWDPRTGGFAAYNRQGLTKTFFKPGSPDYFERQPGRPVRLKPDSNPAGR